jgi:hypothetical protein
MSKEFNRDIDPSLRGVEKLFLGKDIKNDDAGVKRGLHKIRYAMNKLIKVCPKSIDDITSEIMQTVPEIHREEIKKIYESMASLLDDMETKRQASDASVINYYGVDNVLMLQLMKCVKGRDDDDTLQELIKHTWTIGGNPSRDITDVDVSKNELMKNNGLIQNLSLVHKLASDRSKSIKRFTKDIEVVDKVRISEGKNFGFELNVDGKWIHENDYNGPRFNLHVNVTDRANIIDCTVNYQKYLGIEGHKQDPKCLSKILDEITLDAKQLLKPQIVYNILRGFCVMGRKRSDGHVDVEDIEDYLARANAGNLVDKDNNPVSMKHEELKTLLEDVNVQQKLDLFIKYVNANPAIINSANGRPLPYKSNDDYGRQRPVGNNTHCFDQMKNTLSTGLSLLHNRVGHITGSLGFPGFQFSPLSALGHFSPVLSGGEYDPYNSENIINDGVDIPVLSKASVKLENIFKSYIGKLNSMDKTLDPENYKKINEVIANMKMKENTILNFLTKLGRYVSVTRTSGHSVVNDTDLREGYNEYEKSINKYNKRGNNLLSIMSTLYGGIVDLDSTMVALPVIMGN